MCVCLCATEYGYMCGAKGVSSELVCGRTYEATCMVYVLKPST